MATTCLPRLALVEQAFDTTCLDDIESAVLAELAPFANAVRPGARVAVTAGSRGIHAIDRILRTVCGFLRSHGATPFIVPAMGSHGGATAEGQAALLADKGIDEQSVGAPVLSSMEAVCLGETPCGVPAWCDRLAAEADAVVVINRVKPHTKFKAEIESGLMKMLAVGLGKHVGAALVHRLAPRRGFADLILEVGRLMLRRLPVLFGLGIVENGYGWTRQVRALAPDSLEAGERELLRLAKQLSPKLPVSDLDVLVVDQIGKDISGTGMDTNVTGRNRDIAGTFETPMRVGRILVLDLSPGSGGNANGIGFADFTTDRLVQAMDRHKTVTNAMTALSPEKAAIPIHFPTDREALAAALDSTGLWTPGEVRLIRIRDTLHLDLLAVSEALLPELPGNCKVVREPREMAFEPDGNLEPV